MKGFPTVSSAVLTLVCFLATGVSAFSQSLSNPRALGVVVYKKHGFLPDTDAVAYEYSHWHDRAGVMRFTTLKGTRVTVHPSSDVFLVPYPGRTFDSKEDALLLIDFANKRYPQYSALWKNLKIAWNNPRPTSSATVDARTAQINREKADKYRESLEERQRFPFGMPEKPDFTDSDAAAPAGPTADGGRGDGGNGGAGPTESPGAGSPGPPQTGDEKKSEEAADKLLEKSLELIRTYYETVGEMSR